MVLTFKVKTIWFYFFFTIETYFNNIPYNLPIATLSDIVTERQYNVTLNEGNVLFNDALNTSRTLNESLTLKLAVYVNICSLKKTWNSAGG